MFGGGGRGELQYALWTGSPRSPLHSGQVPPAASPPRASFARSPLRCIPAPCDRKGSAVHGRALPRSHAHAVPNLPETHAPAVPLSALRLLLGAQPAPRRASSSTLLMAALARPPPLPAAPPPPRWAGEAQSTTAHTPPAMPPPYCRHPAPLLLLLLSMLPWPGTAAQAAAAAAQPSAAGPRGSAQHASPPRLPPALPCCCCRPALTGSLSPAAAVCAPALGPFQQIKGSASRPPLAPHPNRPAAALAYGCGAHRRRPPRCSPTSYSYCLSFRPGPFPSPHVSSLPFSHASHLQQGSRGQKREQQQGPENKPTAAPLAAPGWRLQGGCSLSALCLPPRLLSSGLHSQSSALHFRGTSCRPGPTPGLFSPLSPTLEAPPQPLSSPQTLAPPNQQRQPHIMASQAAGAEFLERRLRAAPLWRAPERSPEVAAFVEWMQACELLPLTAAGTPALPMTPATQRQVGGQTAADCCRLPEHPQQPVCIWGHRGSLNGLFLLNQC